MDRKRHFALWPRCRAVLFVACLTCLFAAVAWPAAALRGRSTLESGHTLLVSVNRFGQPATDLSANPAISYDGRFVAFDSRDTQLVAGDSNGKRDVFVRDLLLGETERVSVTSSGAQLNGHSYDPAISADGRYVVFTSEAANLHTVGSAAYRGGGINVFVHDRQTGATVLVSADTRGRPADRHAWLPDISADGGYVVFSSHSKLLVEPDLNGIKRDVFLRDMATGTTEFVDVLADGHNPWSGGSLGGVSGDGRLVVFRSLAGNLVPGDSNGKFDIFVRDRSTGATTRVSVATDGAQGTVDAHFPDIAAGGGAVVFETTARLHADDTNGYSDIYLRDLATDETLLVSLPSPGLAANGASSRASVSADGQMIAFASTAANLVPGDANGFSDIFVHDRAASTTHRISLTHTGLEATGGPSNYPDISGDGRSIAFVSSARNLISGSLPAAAQIYVRDLGRGPFYAVSGVIELAEGGPLAGAIVAADTGQTTATAGDGSFRLEELPSGARTFTPSRPGYVFDPPSMAVELPPDASDLRFVATAVPTSVISGTVVLPNGNGLPGVTVSAGANSAVTDALGRYRLEFLPAGAYNVTPLLAGYGFQPGARTITVPPDAGEVNFEAVVLATYTISGVVKRPNGSPIAGVVVTDEAGRTATTNGKGRYTLAGVPAGTHTITALRAGLAFTPAWRVVTVPPNATSQSFTGR